MLRFKLRPLDRNIFINWQIDETLPLTDDDICLVEYAWASEKELSYIKRRFQNIPFIDNIYEMIWFGDDARFIAGNL
jgi:hypothetical protein